MLLTKTKGMLGPESRESRRGRKERRKERTKDGCSTGELVESVNSRKDIDAK